jgi:hypothetical protein
MSRDGEKDTCNVAEVMAVVRHFTRFCLAGQAGFHSEQMQALQPHRPRQPADAQEGEQYRA